HGDADDDLAVGIVILPCFHGGERPAGSFDVAPAAVGEEVAVDDIGAAEPVGVGAGALVAAARGGGDDGDIVKAGDGPGSRGMGDMEADAVDFSGGQVVIEGGGAEAHGGAGGEGEIPPGGFVGGEIEDLLEFLAGGGGEGVDV